MRQDSSSSNGGSPRALRRFTLPQICACGAEGKITFEPQPLRPGKRDPEPAMTVAAGPFEIDAHQHLVCLGCGERLSWRPA